MSVAHKIINVVSKHLIHYTVGVIKCNAIQNGHVEMLRNSKGMKL